MDGKASETQRWFWCHATIELWLALLVTDKALSKLVEKRMLFIYKTNNYDPWQCFILDIRCAWVNSDLIKLKILCVLMDTKKVCTPLVVKLHRTGEVLFISVTSRIFFIGLVYPANHLIMCFLENDLHNSIWKQKWVKFEHASCLIFVFVQKCCLTSFSASICALSSAPNLQ